MNLAPVGTTVVASARLAPAEAPQAGVIAAANPRSKPRPGVAATKSALPHPPVTDPTPTSVTESVPHARVGQRTFHVLAVCTGNVCRSPAVERLLAGALGPDVTVSSAGIGAQDRQPMDAPMAKLLADSGLRPDGFEARRLTAEIAADADLIVTTTRHQRSAVVRLHPPAVRRTFTLRELVHLIDGVTAEELTAVAAEARATASGNAAAPDARAISATDRLAALVRLAPRRRHLIRRDAATDDIADAHGGSDRQYARTFEQIRTATGAIASIVVGDGVRYGGSS